MPGREVGDLGEGEEHGGGRAAPLDVAAGKEAEDKGVLVQCEYVSVDRSASSEGSAQDI